ncbi:hypothetical protein QP027_07050 [Corynebacterium breve]|uniref:DUF1648 domain-containing protein n=1 Tax=Corynebacterium breve TaxID=3049799 RepID=A0ABY8VH75_9CORY|nr:hypothetical protein [Corynebacterium breve]WIM66890.1 hypothetical protein QP027_07050 [Corynebacterium breve]
MKKFWLTSLVPMAVIALVLHGAAAFYLAQAPVLIGTHFDFGGRPNDWTSPDCSTD